MLGQNLDVPIISGLSTSTTRARSSPTRRSSSKRSAPRPGGRSNRCPHLWTRTRAPMPRYRQRPGILPRRTEGWTTNRYHHAATENSEQKLREGQHLLTPNLLSHNVIHEKCRCARVAELADAQDLGSCLSQNNEQFLIFILSEPTITYGDLDLHPH